jgi:hypothetical protein
LTECNLRLAFAIAREHQGRGLPFADLVQEGMIGLVRRARMRTLRVFPRVVRSSSKLCVGCGQLLRFR